MRHLLQVSGRSRLSQGVGARAETGCVLYRRVWHHLRRAQIKGAADDAADKAMPACAPHSCWICGSHDTREHCARAGGQAPSSQAPGAREATSWADSAGPRASFGGGWSRMRPLMSLNSSSLVAFQRSAHLRVGLRICVVLHSLPHAEAALKHADDIGVRQI